MGIIYKVESISTLKKSDMLSLGVRARQQTINCELFFGDRCVYVKETKDALIACLCTFVTEAETKVKHAKGIELWKGRLNEFVQSDNIEFVVH
jgi:hypothetical protein